MLIDTDNHWFPFNKNGKANYERYIGQWCDLQSNIYQVSKLFALSFKRIEEKNVKKDNRDSFLRYYVPNVEIKDFNVLIS